MRRRATVGQHSGLCHGPKRLVDGIRELARMARAAQEGWSLAYTVYDEGEEPESTPPDDDRNVLVFMNGHVGIDDTKGRKGGGWGHNMGFYNHDKQSWYVGGRCRPDVTHWTDLPPAPARKTNGVMEITWRPAIGGLTDRRTVAESEGFELTCVIDVRVTIGDERVDLPVGCKLSKPMESRVFSVTNYKGETLQEVTA